MAKKTEGTKDWLSRWGNSFSAISADEVQAPVEVIPTGCIGLDMALGVGGIPVGHVTRIEGLPGAYKTTLCQQIAANAIRSGRPVYWLDTESGFEARIAVLNGLPLNSDQFRLWRFNPYDEPESMLCYENMAQFFVQTMKDMEKHPKGALFIVDSYSALVTRAQLDGSLSTGDLGDVRIANQAMLDSRFFPILLGYLKESKSALIVLQQERANIASPYGGTKASCSYSVQHGAWLHLKLRKIKDEQIHVDIPKNKSYFQNMETDFYVSPLVGIDSTGEIIELGKKFGVVTQSGAFYKINGENLQGKDRVRVYFGEHPDVYEALRLEIMEKARNG